MSTIRRPGSTLERPEGVGATESPRHTPWEWYVAKGGGLPGIIPTMDQVVGSAASGPTAEGEVVDLGFGSGSAVGGAPAAPTGTMSTSSSSTLSTIAVYCGVALAVVIAARIAVGVFR